MRHVVELRERFDSRVTGADEHEPELRWVVGMDRRALELQQDLIAERDRIGKVLEPGAMLDQAGNREHACRRAEGDDELLVADLERSRERVDGDVPALAIECRDVAEHELGVRAHLPERDHDVPWFERPGRGLGEERRVEHRALAGDDRRAAALQKPRDVASGEAAAEDERSPTCLATLHGSCLPRWPYRSR